MKNLPKYQYAEEILLKVSRTFALNINVLRGELHNAVLLAYLYLRIADTVEDDPVMQASEKERVLGLFSNIFEDESKLLERLEIFMAALPASWNDSESYDQQLSVNSRNVVPLLLELPVQFRKPICDVVIEMCAGMAKFALREEDARRGGWLTLDSVEDLDEYCYYVAGIVGKFLSNVFYAAKPGIGVEKIKIMKTLDVSFGLALQITNIVKDVREDSLRNVCFVPEEICKRHGFNSSPEMFLPNANASDRAAVMAELVEKAWKHVLDGVEYTLLIPRRYARIRLFCLWPLMMAAENLKAIGNGAKIFEVEGKVKITRDDVKRILKSTMLHFYSNSWISQTIEDLRQ